MDGGANSILRKPLLENTTVMGRRKESEKEHISNPTFLRKDIIRTKNGSVLISKMMKLMSLFKVVMISRVKIKKTLLLDSKESFPKNLSPRSYKI